MTRLLLAVLAVVCCVGALSAPALAHSRGIPGLEKPSPDGLLERGVAHYAECRLVLREALDDRQWYLQRLQNAVVSHKLMRLRLGQIKLGPGLVSLLRQRKLELEAARLEGDLPYWQQRQTDCRS